MYVEYEYYLNTHKGNLTETEFDSLENDATLLVTQYMEQYIASWDLKKSIEDYGCDMKKAVCVLIDHIHSLGGKSAMQAGNPTDLDLKSVKTEGFEYSYNDETLKERTMYFNGVPFSKVAVGLIEKELRIHGYMKRKVN